MEPSYGRIPWPSVVWPPHLRLRVYIQARAWSLRELTAPLGAPDATVCCGPFSLSLSLSLWLYGCDRRVRVCDCPPAIDIRLCPASFHTLLDRVPASLVSLLSQGSSLLPASFQAPQPQPVFDPGPTRLPRTVAALVRARHHVHTVPQTLGPSVYGQTLVWLCGH